MNKEQNSDKSEKSLRIGSVSSRLISEAILNDLWRRGADYVEATDPHLLGMAIDKAIEVLRLSNVSESSFIAKIDDTTAFGVPHHNHSKHRVYVDGLTYEQAKKIEYFLNEIAFKNYFR